MNVAPLRMEKQARHPVLIEFWDVCRPSCLRTLPYLRAWHERYADAGLRVIGVHSLRASRPAATRTRVREAIARLGIAHPVLLDPDFRLWRAYANARLAVALPVRPAPAAVRGPPRRGRLPRDRARDPGAARDRRAADAARRPRRRRRRRRSSSRPPTSRARTAGAYAAGEVWVVVDRPGTVLVNGEVRVLDRLGAHRVIRHERHTAGELQRRRGRDATVLMTAFLPGLA